MLYEIITTYFERPAWMLDMMKRLTKSAGNSGSSIKHLIVDDCSEGTPAEYIINDLEVYSNYGILLYRNEKRNGRKEYYKTMNFLIGHLQPCDYVISIQDDVLPCKKFFEIIDNLLVNRPRIAFNIHYDNSRKSSKWIDGAGSVIPYEYLKEIDFTVGTVKEIDTKNCSGFWTYLNRLFQEKNLECCRINCSLVYHQGHSLSTLNTIKRNLHPMKTWKFIDNIKDDFKVEFIC